MAAELALLKQPVALRPEHIASAPTTLRIKHANRTGVDYKVTTVAPEASSSKDSESTVLFTVDGEFASWSQRRVFRDANGLPLFNLRRKSTGVTFFIEIPGDEDRPLATFAPRSSVLKDKCDIYLANAAADGEEVMLEVRGQDIWKRWTHVYFNGALVMRTKLADMVAVYVPGKRISWEAEVAEGMDLSLATAITVFLAENLYNSSYPSSYSSNTKKPEDADPTDTVHIAPTK
ncbi:uncharacterized protein ACHE_40400S [Aspergillus chevalieri]|uniref:Tubby C-terminal-like domain-containing protein n=1 Tax=Aspergillus chevalieri TaxID=182096 RepID=A0A7R7VNG8_ASPCH|nr:uncharacterized protein ACHE_40400S [Aspergillus chevalieri]BCR87836.1 hypothetical protein ACHE_40400S [Aspergillus chevalieri]